MLKHTGVGLQDVVLKPVEGMQKNGARGLAVGMKDGLVGGATNIGQGVYGLGSEVVSGVGGTLETAVNVVGAVHAPGLQEFQMFLHVNPGLRDTVRRFQPTVASARASLQQVDDIFYWAVFKTTQKIVFGILAAIVISLLFRKYMGAVTGFGYFIGGSVVIGAQSPGFKYVVRAIQAAIAVWTKGSKPFPNRPWFTPI